MAYRSLIACALAAFAGVADAAYRPLNPPPGWRVVEGQFAYVRDTRGRVWDKGVILDAASFSMRGRELTIPAGLKLAPGAARAAAGLLFGNPWLAAGIYVAGWLAENVIEWNEEKQRWETPQSGPFPVSDGYEYGVTVPGSNPPQDFWSPDVNAACGAYVSGLNQLFNEPGRFTTVTCAYGNFQVSDKGGAPNTVALNRRGSDCPQGWFIIDGACAEDVPYREVPKPEFVDKLGDDEFTDDIANELPPEWPLPVLLPRINPVPQPWGDPQPTYVPEGDPVPNPQYDPQQQTSTTNMPYVQPGVNIVPANTNTAPWNVDLQPVNRPQETNESNPDVDHNPNKVPDEGGQTGPPGKAPPVANPGREGEQPGLCDMYPGILACEKLLPPEPDSLETKEAEFDFQIEGGFGGAGVCPQPISVSLGGHQYLFAWDGLCDALVLLKPLILAFAWLSAAFILLGREGF